MSGPVGALVQSQENKLLLVSVCVLLDTGETEKLRQLRRFFSLGRALHFSQAAWSRLAGRTCSGLLQAFPTSWLLPTVCPGCAPLLLRPRRASSHCLKCPWSLGSPPTVDEIRTSSPLAPLQLRMTWLVELGVPPPRTPERMHREFL